MGVGAILMALATAAASASSWPPSDRDYLPYEDVSCREAAPRIAYPDRLSRRGVGGVVVYRVTVDEQDRFVSAELQESSGNSRLDAAVLKVLPHWCFRAGSANGKPIGGHILVSIRFTP